MTETFANQESLIGTIAWAHSLLLLVPFLWLTTKIEWKEYIEWRAAHPEGFHFNFHLPHRHAKI